MRRMKRRFVGPAVWTGHSRHRRQRPYRVQRAGYAFASRTHVAPLGGADAAHRRSGRMRLPGLDEVPEYGITMGIQTIMDAQRIVLVGVGRKQSRCRGGGRHRPGHRRNARVGAAASPHVDVHRRRSGSGELPRRAVLARCPYYSRGGHRRLGRWPILGAHRGLPHSYRTQSRQRDRGGQRLGGSSRVRLEASWAFRTTARPACSASACVLPKYLIRFGKKRNDGRHNTEA